MTRKGFPESYDLPAILRFMSDIKAGKRNVTAPVYSHLTYDVLKDEHVVIDQPDILIVEGLNVLQTGRPPRDGRGIPNTSDFFDFSIYIDADPADLQHLVHRALPGAARRRLPQSEVLLPPLCIAQRRRGGDTATRIWETINLVNLRENVLPTRPRADLVLRKGADHFIRSVFLRRYSRPTALAWALRFTSGLAPICEITSAAASAPSCAQCGQRQPMREAVEKAGGEEIARPRHVHHLADRDRPGLAWTSSPCTTTQPASERVRTAMGQSLRMACMAPSKFCVW